jgi:N,N'-diacetyllegionaminate synthase
MKTLVIAEAGVNHNGDIEKALALVDIAAESGADIVKFQTFKADELVTESAPKAEYQEKNDGLGESQYKMLKRLELSPEMHEQIIDHCNLRGIKFLSTGFDIKTVAFLCGLGLPILKIPSGEITNLPYLRYVGSLGRDIIMSTGMATLKEIECAIASLEEAGTSKDKIIVLHCTTEYPAPMDEVNLNAMLTIQKAFGVKVGYSDHTAGIEVAMAAVALGAQVIEKHFTLDKALPGPDHLSSLGPEELVKLVKGIRNIELAIGDGIKIPSESEKKNMLIARKSIVAATQIYAGDEFSDDNIAAKRPGMGISPMCWDQVIGQKAIRDFQPGELIEI